jgi:multiple sugar transport system substrate-binding protein
MKIPRRAGVSRRSSRWAAVVGAAALTASLAACSSGPQGVVVNLYGGASASKFDEIIADCNKQAAGRYTIVGNLLPSDADGQRDQLVRRLAAQDAGMDLLGMDVTWTAEFAEAGWIRPLNAQQAAAATQDILQPPVDTATWKDQLYGIPKHTNVQLLWYRKDLVPTPPTTFDEMIQMSQALKDQGKPYEIGFTAAQYEGYVVTINNLVKGFGGRFVNEDSTAATVDDKAVEGLTLLQKLASSGLTSSSLSNAQEPEVFADLQNDRSAFSLNWPYVLASMKEANPDLVPNLGYAPFPKVAADQPVTTTLGGMNFAISTYSRHPDEAFDAAMCLRSPEHQLQHAINAGEPPTNRTVYDQPDMQEAYPMAQVMLTELESAKPRPISPVYQNISTVLSTTLSPPAAINPQAAAEELRTGIQDAIEGKGILP